MDRYGTHIPTNAMLLSHLKPKFIVEFGMGLYSTPLFAKFAESLVSFEMQSEEWYAKVVEGIRPQKDSVVLWKTIGPTLAIETFDNIVKLKGIPDYVFVDGHGDTRHICIQHALDAGVTTIVFHDSEQECYQYENVVLPKGFTRLDVMDYLPWTSIITNNSRALELLQQTSLKTRYRTQE
jgi:hypothetical protein